MFISESGRESEHTHFTQLKNCQFSRWVILNQVYFELTGEVPNFTDNSDLEQYLSYQIHKNEYIDRYGVSRPLDFTGPTAQQIAERYFNRMLSALKLGKEKKKRD